MSGIERTIAPGNCGSILRGRWYRHARHRNGSVCAAPATPTFTLPFGHWYLHKSSREIWLPSPRFGERGWG